MFAPALVAVVLVVSTAPSVPAARDGSDAGVHEEDFDWHVPAGATIVLDTTHAMIRGGPGDAPIQTKEVLGGIVEVRHLVVPAGASIEAQGPNPLVIFASGDVHIDGRISVNGGDGTDIWTLNRPDLPAHGAPGNAGGGMGGTGSRFIDRADAVGAPGFGAFDVPWIGGQGGESGWHPSNANFGEMRRAAGGGGGVFARDVLNVSGCLDQSAIGLDAEDGFPGSTMANAALRPGEKMPWGGRRGRGPFADGDPANDFYGLMIVDEGSPEETLVGGELPGLGAGAGGGGGGDATRTDVYPPPSFDLNSHNRGAGGGGGAGALMIFARGDIVLGPGGRLSADGGHGAGGENTNYVNRIGGGSGGGSGGHIVLQSLQRIDLSDLSPTIAAITAFGGQGGAGAQNSGGADDGGEIPPLADAKHVGVTGPGDLSDNPWIPPVPRACQWGIDVVRAAGGDGGPGVIQLHVLDLDAIMPPGGDLEAIPVVVRPPPVGWSAPEHVFPHWVGRLVPTL